MKRKIYRILALILFLTFLPLSSYAQKKGYEEGFVVLKIKDTLYGFIKDRKSGSFSKLYKKIKFRGEKGTRKYRPDQIIAYKKGVNIFESMWISDSGRFLDQNYNITPGKGKLHFLKVVQKGFLSYYYWEFEDSDSGYIDYVGYFKKENNSSLVRVTQGIFGLRKKNLATFLGDCPELASKIRGKSIKDPREIVTFYNNCKRNN